MQRPKTPLKMENPEALRTRLSLFRWIQILMMKASFLRSKKVQGNPDEGGIRIPLQVSTMKTLRNLHWQRTWKDRSGELKLGLRSIC